MSKINQKLWQQDMSGGSRREHDDGYKVGIFSFKLQ